MAIRPIDMQVLLPRSAEILKQDTLASARGGAEQQIFSSILQKKSELDSTRVLQNEAVEHQNVDKDGRGNSGEPGSKKNKHKIQQKEEKKQPKQNPYGSMFDFTI